MDKEIEARIAKDIEKFDETKDRLAKAGLSDEENMVFELAKMYAEDSKAWLAKKDYFTAFAGISYAHGLADALMKLKHIE
ncbi:MAG: DUF357 domain-containing protein [Candidatus Micrarchaeaceae archaeon]